MSEPRTTVVFDLDGTLADSASGITASYRHTLAHYGLEATDEAIRACIGPPLAEGLATLGVPEAQLSEAVGVYRHYFSSTGIYDNSISPGLPPVLHDLHHAGLTLALATSKREDFAGRILDLFELSPLFSVVAGATEDGARTTKTEIVGHVLRELGQPHPTAVAVVGDRRDDMLAAAAWGAVPIGVTWGYGSEAELRSAGAQILVATPAELRACLLISPGPIADRPR